MAEVCGIDEESFLKVAAGVTSNSGRDRTSAFCYAVGWTQHTVGVQYIRTAAILQLLFGNMGRPGGGILALRGHASIQGSTDISTLFNLLPGYLMPELFCEVSPELAAERGLTNGECATITTARGEIECRVLVTPRVRPLRLGKRRKRVVHQIGLPYHWAYLGLVIGDNVNELIGFVADPNVSLQESKALTADIVPGRRSRSRKRRVVTSGPLVAPYPPERDPARCDIAQVDHSKEVDEHGARSGQRKR